MVLTILLVLLLISSFTLAIQDFREFQVSLWILAVFSTLILASVFVENELLFALKSAGSSLLISSLVMLILLLYARVRFSDKSFFKEVFGLGDVVFVLAASCFFTPVGFLVFLITSSLVAICSYLILRVLKNDNSEAYVPFIGYMGLVFSGFVVCLLVMKDKIDYISSLLLNLDI